MNDIATWINTAIGIIGIVVGIIGWRSLSAATKIVNKVEAKNIDQVQNAQVINNTNGLDSYAVIRLTRDTTKDELQRIIDDFNNSNTEIILNGGNASYIH